MLGKWLWGEWLLNSSGRENIFLMRVINQNTKVLFWDVCILGSILLTKDTKLSYFLAKFLDFWKNSNFLSVCILIKKIWTQILKVWPAFAPNIWIHFSVKNFKYFIELSPRVWLFSEKQRTYWNDVNLW